MQAIATRNSSGWALREPYAALREMTPEQAEAYVKATPIRYIVKFSMRLKRPRAEDGEPGGDAAAADDEALEPAAKTGAAAAAAAASGGSRARAQPAEDGAAEIEEP